MLMRTQFLAPTVLLLLPIIAGCTNTTEESPFFGRFDQLVADAKDAGLSEDSKTLEFLEDGVVTLEEYQQGFADSVACVEDHGYVIERQYVNKFDSWRMLWEPDIDQSVPDDSTDWSFECGRDHVMFLELAYSITAENRVDARLLAHAQECLQGIGGTLQGTELSIDDLAASTGDRTAVIGCLWISLQELYPGEIAADAYE